MSTSNHKILLWKAIHKYVRACGGDPNKLVYGNGDRMNAVVEIERLVYEKEEKNER